MHFINGEMQMAAGGSSLTYLAKELGVYRVVSVQPPLSLRGVPQGRRSNPASEIASTTLGTLSRNDGVPEPLHRVEAYKQGKIWIISNPIYLE